MAGCLQPASSGWNEVPVIELAGMSEAEKQAYIIADNKLAVNAGWDRDLLALELGELDALGFDLSLTGFGGDELAGLLNLGNPGLTDPDDVPEPPTVPVTRPGNVWLLGRHRLVCGDATNPDNVATGPCRRLPSPHGHRSSLRGRATIPPGGSAPVLPMVAPRSQAATC